MALRSKRRRKGIAEETKLIYISVIVVGEEGRRKGRKQPTKSEGCFVVAWICFVVGK